MLWLRLAISFGLLGLLAFVAADPREIVRLVMGVRWEAFLLAVALTAADRVLMAYKWQLLMRARAVAVPLRIAVRAYFASSFAGLFLPVTVGADAIRVLAVRDYGIHAVTASVVLERALGAVAVLTAALLSCALMASELTTQRMTVVAASLGTAVAVLAAVFLGSLWLAARWGTRQGAAGWKISQVATAYASYRRHPLTLVTFLMLSVVESYLPALVAFVVARGLGFHVPWWVFAATIPIALTVARLPISLGGFGVQEVSFVYLAGLLAFEPSDALTTMLVTDAALVLTLLPAAFDVRMLSLRHSAAVPPLVPDLSPEAPAPLTNR